MPRIWHGWVIDAQVTTDSIFDPEPMSVTLRPPRLPSDGFQALLMRGHQGSRDSPA